MYEQLKSKLEGKQATIAVIGLGYVGLPLVIEFCRSGFSVIGYDTSSSRISHLVKGEKYITDIEPEETTPFVQSGKFLPTTDESKLGDADVYIICVPTPLRHVTDPDMSYIIASGEAIARHVKPGSLVVLESTTYPGTSREELLPRLELAGLTIEEDVFLCFSPERVDPGNKNYPIRRIPKVVGGIGEKSAALGRLLYSFAMDKVVPVSSIEAAETAKLLENTFRLVNIALVNEFAMVCDKLGIDVWEVIEAAKTKPFGFMPFYPGPGIGGHCIPCDPIYLSWKARQIGFKTEMIDLAAQTNRYMPRYVTEKVLELSGKQTLKEVKVLLLGVTYKKDVKDLRESPSLDIIDIFTGAGAELAYHDPYVPYIKIDHIDMTGVELTESELRQYDVVVIVTDHSNVDYAFVQRHAKMVFDTRCVYKDRYANVERI